MGCLRIAKVIDQWGWSYDFIGREQNRYSKHHIITCKHDEIDYDNVDIIYIHSPNIDVDIAKVIPREARKRNIKLIGAYGGDPRYWGEKPEYSFADLIVTISPETYSFAKENDKDKLVIFLPEGIDTEYFVPKLRYKNFKIGWAGNKTTIKREWILDKLNYSIIRKSDWGPKFWVKDKSLRGMLDFYHSLDVFILVSETECMPRVVLESMACGLPVICTDVGNIRFLLDKRWIIPAKPDELVIEKANEKLNELRNSTIIKNTGLRNRVYVEKNFSWKIIQPFWDSIFEDLVNNNYKSILKRHKKYYKKLKKRTKRWKS